VSIWYDYADDAEETDPKTALEGEAHFGLVMYNYSSAGVAHVPKPAFLAAKVLRNQLYNRIFEGRLAATATRAASLALGVEKSTAFVLWFGVPTGAVAASGTHSGKQTISARSGVCSASALVVVVWVAGTGREADPASNRSTPVTFTLPSFHHNGTDTGRDTLTSCCYTEVSMLGAVKERRCLPAVTPHEALTMTVNATSYPSYICISPGGAADRVAGR
jgi:hypothetical protein